MHINSHFSPTSLGHGSRPDQAGNAQGKGQQFQPATAEVEPAVATDTTTAVAPTEETTRPGKSGQSPAHLARAQQSGIALAGAVSQNFGWLVSQIARGLDISPAAPEGDGTGDGVVVSDETVPTGEETPLVDGTAGAGATPGPVVEDPVASLLSELNEESTTPPADEPGDLVDELVGTLLDETADETEVT